MQVILMVNFPSILQRGKKICERQYVFFEIWISLLSIALSQIQRIATPPTAAAIIIVSEAIHSLIVFVLYLPLLLILHILMIFF